MGRIIVKKVRGMSFRAKSALTLTVTLLVTIFMYQGWLKPLLSGAATTTYYLNALPATSVGVDGTTNMTSLSTTTYDIPTNGSSNVWRGQMNTTPPTGTTRIRVYDSTSTYTTYTDQEYYRAYTPAYAVDTRIDPNALAEFECYVRTSWGGGASASFKVQLFDYNPATGAVVQIGSTITKTLATNTTALQRFVNGTGTAVNFGNAAYKVLAGHRLEVRYLGSANNCDPILLVNQAASSAPSGTSRLIVTETVIGDVTIGNGTAEPASITIGPSVDGTTSYPIDTFSVQLSNPIYDTLDTVNVTLATGMSQYVSRVLITNSDNSTTYGSAAAPGSGDVWTVQLAGLLPSTTLTNYQVRIIPKSHADVPAPPGGTYAVTALVTAATHSQLGNMTISDSGSATLTIDNSSPADATWGGITPGNAQVALGWTNPGSDFAGVVVLRNTIPTADNPIEGRSYAVGNVIGTAQVVYVGTGTSFTDTGVVNGIGYYYTIYAFDAFNNYAVGATSGPYVPVNPNMTNPGVPSAIAINSTSIMITMPYTGDPNANNTYTINYRISGAGSWTNWGTGSHTASPYATTITGLDSANLYDVQCIYNDPDSINVEGFPSTYTVEIDSIALPAYAVAPGAVAVDALGTSTINVYVPYTNDLNGNSTYKVEYKLSTDSTWKTWIAGGNHEPSPYTTAISGLKPDTAYDVRVTFQDPDGINGGSPAVQTFTGVQTAPTLSIGLTHNSDRFPGTTKWGGKWGVVGGQYGDITCINCHQPGAPNIKSFRPTLNPANSSVTAVYYPSGADASVSFQNVTSMGDDSTAHTSTVRVCEVCHSQNKFHNANASAQTSKVHYNHTDCVVCHPHNVGFKASCDICHGLPPIVNKTDGSTNTGLVWRSGPSTSPTVPTGATSPASPGAHATHAVTRHFACDTCHNGTPMPDVNMKITLGFNANPVNTPGFKGSIVMGNFSGHSPLSNGYGFQAGNAGTTVSTGSTYANTCSVACHGNWSGSGGSIYRPSWVGSGQAACGACHGTTAANPPSRGSHTKHASSSYYGFACTTCHPSVTDTSHVNASVKIMLNSADTRIGAGARYNGFLNYSTGAPAPSAVYRQCTNIYCHSNGQAANLQYASPTWGTTLTCTGCHGNYSTVGGAGTALSGKHASHVNNSTVFGTNTGFGCEACHAKTVSNSTTISNTANHVNKFIDYSGAFANDNYDTGTKQCQNLYCHSNGNRKNIVYVNPAIWTSATTYGCNGCHGTSNAATGAPDYTNGGAGSTTANSHAIHVARLGITSTTGCYYCHANTVDSGTANKLSGVAPMRHINGTVDVVPGGTFTIGGTVSFTYDPATMTCTSISCHGTTSATWGDNNCVECHSVSQGNRVAVGSQFSAQSHHIQGNFTNTQLNVRCYQCHWEADSNGYINTTYHAGTTGSGKGVTLVLQGTGARPATYAAGAFTVYTSGGASNSSRTQIAKINTVCIKCHNSTNAAYQPFGDGKTPEQYSWDGYSVDERYSQAGTTPWGKYTDTTSNDINPKNTQTKAYSAHGRADLNQRGWNTSETWPNTSGTTSVLCFDCHNSHGTAASGVMSSYSSATGWNKGAILKSTTAGKGGYTATYTPTAGGSTAAGSKNAYNPGGALCFNCHNNATASASFPWGYTGTFGDSQAIYGYWDTPYFGAGTFNSVTRFSYKGFGTHGTNMGGHFGASSTLTTTVSKPTLPNAAVKIKTGINGLCTPCHDPHGVSPGLGANEAYGVPLLKGTWMTSPWKEDAAPSGTTEARGGGSRVSIQYSGSTPQYHLDQNTFGPTTINNDGRSGSINAPSWSKTNTTRVTEVVTQFAGLCTGCHTQTALAPKAGLNVAPDAWKSVSRIHGTVKGWATTASASDGNYNNTMHSFACSKCHAPHNTRLPRLMVTNCLDGAHRGQVQSGAAFGYDSASGSSGAGGGRGPMGGGGSGSREKNAGPWFFGTGGSRSTTANIPTCHNVSNAGGAGTSSNANQLWNTKTPWTN